jgi:hypothetical protein
MSSIILKIYFLIPANYSKYKSEKKCSTGEIDTDHLASLSTFPESKFRIITLH